MQYRHADPLHAREALLTCAKFLEGMEETKPDKMRETDLAFTYTRLALLEDAEENSKQSQAYMNQARPWYKASGSRDRSDAERKAAMRKIDEALAR